MAEQGGGPSPAGDPGQPGQEGQKGSPPGGTGGRGGRGGIGQKGERGRPGRTSWLPLLGYAILVAGIMAAFVNTHRVTQRNGKAITALCVYKADLGARIKNGEDFLEEHPQGIPGVDIMVLERSIQQQKRTKAVFDKTLRGECRDESP